MKLQIFSKLTAKPRGRKVVRASARAARANEDYYEAEPNMKLSHAFMVVLVLHIVAVGGIYAFNQLNAARIGVAGPDRAALSAQPKKAVPSAEPVVAARQPGDADEPLPTVASSPNIPQTRLSASEITPAPVAAVPAAKIMTATKSADPIVESKPPAPKQSAARAETSAPGTYTVAKGDNPYKIAKKLGVGYQALLDLNKITDPTKLQIGTVLKVPTKKN